MIVVTLMASHMTLMIFGQLGLVLEHFELIEHVFERRTPDSLEPPTDAVADQRTYELEKNLKSKTELPIILVQFETILITQQSCLEFHQEITLGLRPTAVLARRFPPAESAQNALR